jgi:hypothetical protein
MLVERVGSENPLGARVSDGEGPAVPPIRMGPVRYFRPIRSYSEGSSSDEISPTETTMTINIKLQGGPCDGEFHDGVRDTTRRITRSASHPGVAYDISNEYDEPSGRRIFTFRPMPRPKPGR